MLNTSYPNPESNTSRFTETACKRCGSTELFTKPQGVHTGLFCRECNLWQKWISKGDTWRFQTKPKLTPVTDLKPVAEKVDSSHDSCAERFEKIERELTVLVRAVLACGMLRGSGAAPSVEVNDGLVSKFVEELQADDGN